MRTTPRMLGVAALVALVALSLPAPARADETYPSWADVQAARSTTATTQAAVERITGLLSGLEATAASLGDAAIVANGAAATAQADSGTAAARAAALSARLAVASDKASAADDQLGRTGRSSTGRARAASSPGCSCLPTAGPTCSINWA